MIQKSRNRKNFMSRIVKQPGDNPKSKKMGAPVTLKILGGEVSEVNPYNYKDLPPDHPTRIHIEQLFEKIKPIKKPIATISQQQMQRRVK